MTVCFSTRAPNADYLGFEASPEAIIAAAKKAEEVGFDAIFVNDHVIVGDDTRSAPWTNLPSNDTLPGAQHACQRRRYSLLRAPRSWNGTPSALNSASFHPDPDAGNQPPAGHAVECRHRFRGRDRIAVRHDQHRDADPTRLVWAAMNDIDTNGS